MKTSIDKVTIEGKEYIPADSVKEKEYFNDFNGLESLIGSKLFIRTVTYHCVGRVIGLKDGFFQLEDASWVADSGRFMNAIKEGVLSEVEPVGDMWVAISSIVDMFPWLHELPNEQK
jgi:hypothetical protein